MASKFTVKPKNRLASLRGIHEVTQTELARIVSTEEIHVTQRAVSRWESYSSAIPTMAAVKIALYFNVSLDWLLCLTDEEEPRPQSKEYARYVEEIRPDLELE